MKTNASMNPIKIVILEDSNDYREDLENALLPFSDVEVVGSFESYESAKDALTHGQCPHPDVALIDIQMPEVNGIEATAKLKELLPALDVIMLTTFSDKRNVFDSICAGAMGYLLKTDDIEDIIRGIRIVHEGGSSLNGNIAHMVLNMFNSVAPKKKNHDLDDVELSILRQLAKGLQKKEIASNLGVEVYQVHYYVRKIYKKLHVNSLSGAVGHAMSEGYI